MYVCATSGRRGRVSANQCIGSLAVGDSGVYGSRGVLKLGAQGRCSLAVKAFCESLNAHKLTYQMPHKKLIEFLITSYYPAFSLITK